VCVFSGVVIVGFINLVYSAIYMGAICLHAPRPTNTAESSRHFVLGIGEGGAAPRRSAPSDQFTAHETTPTVWWEHDASTS
jgi:hypothetical protein